MPYQNPPALPVELELESGFRIRIRHVQPSDRALLQEGLAHFSRRSTYRRFFTPVVTFSEDQLNYLTNVDGRDHVALGVLDVTGGSERGIGIARYIRLPETPHVAEAAVSVIDAYQGRGVGSVLLAALSQFAAAYAIHTFRAYLLVENRRFLQYLVALGATHQSQEHGVIQIDLPVRARLADIPEEASTARRAWKCLEEARRST